MFRRQQSADREGGSAAAQNHRVFFGSAGPCTKAGVATRDPESACSVSEMNIQVVPLSERGSCAHGSSRCVLLSACQY
ncbi:hypothetical protein ILYODFUR_017506 [Ilyodon furcidens]|uniref:Uncharacterized protein n=1 Tax=Ilyodon furcidens TaxID=33524 RepID=A0ABV0TN28_9TELE